jgi:hypothetical protein
VKFPLFSDFSSKSLVFPQKLQEGNLGFPATFNMLMKTLPASEIPSCLLAIFGEKQGILKKNR